MKYFLWMIFVAAGIGILAGCGSNGKPLRADVEPAVLPSEQIASIVADASSEPEADGATAQFVPANLRILYVGHPGSRREADFVTFLKPHFKEVKSADLGAFKEEQAADCDVAIFDYDGDGFKAPQPVLSEKYTRATVTVGVAGAFFCMNRGLKIGYY